MHEKRGLEILDACRSAERPDVILAACDVVLDSVETTDSGDVAIAGWFITQSFIESRRMTVNADAFNHKGGFSMFNGRVLGFHDMYDAPVGRVTQYKVVPGKGIYGTALIWKENDPRLLRAVREGALNAFSIGFAIEKYEYDEKEDTLTVTQGSLKEVSLVNIGADSKALFEVRNALSEPNVHTLDADSHEPQGVSITMAEKPKTIESLADSYVDLGAKFETLQGVINALKDSQTQFAAGIVTKAEMADRLEKLSASVAEIKTQVETAKNQRAYNQTKLAYTDYRSLIGDDFSWLTDDNGNKLGKIAQRAYCLFQMPVDYKAMAEGQELKNLRNLHDAVVIADAMKRYQGRGRHKLENMELYKQLVKATERFDKDVALAMAGGNTGYGAEWLPSELSSEFMELLRVTPSLAGKFQVWNMPKGGSAKFPFQNGRAVVYKGAEAIVDNAEEARKTNIATDVKLFTPEVFIGALVASEELTEDAVLDMVAFIRGELSKALLEGLESAIINGDDSSPHFDNATATKYQSYNVETTFKGLRKLGITNSRDIEVSSASTGVNALELVNFTDAKQDMEVAGLIPQDCLYITGIKGRTQVQQALFKTDALGVLAFMISGTLPTIDGSEIYISGQYAEDLQSTGIYTPGTDTKHTSMVCVHKPSFRIGQRRGVTLEYAKNILTQQQQFVATARWDFGSIAASSIKPVAEMVNIQHTA